MSNYDSYVTGLDKPFAEQINDSLLLSNVFDFTVPVEYPTMCRTSGWSSEGGKKKCAVALVEIVEYDSVTATSSSVTGTGTVKLNFYPNFNSFGLIYSVEWDTDEDITCDIYSENGSLILEDIPNGVITTQVEALTQLQNFQLRFNLTSATLTFFKVTMKNNEDTRYGAEVGISDVNNLQTALDGKASNTNDTILTNLSSSVDTNKFSVIKCEGMIRNGFAIINLRLKFKTGVFDEIITVLKLYDLKFRPKIKPMIYIPVNAQYTSNGNIDKAGSIRVYYETGSYIEFNLIMNSDNIIANTTELHGLLIYPIEDY